jgi:hypothetical protein
MTQTLPLATTEDNVRKRVRLVVVLVVLSLAVACSRSESDGKKYSCNSETIQEIIERIKVLDESYGPYRPGSTVIRESGQKYVADLIEFRTYLRDLYAPEVSEETAAYIEAILEFADAVNTEILTGKVEGLLTKWEVMGDARREFVMAFAARCAIQNREE